MYSLRCSNADGYITEGRERLENKVLAQIGALLLPVSARSRCRLGCLSCLCLAGFLRRSFARHVTSKSQSAGELCFVVPDQDRT